MAAVREGWTVCGNTGDIRKCSLSGGNIDQYNNTNYRMYMLRI